LFGTLGGPEILLILFIALIVFGPRKLPEIGKSLGKMMVEFRRASNDFRRTIEDEVEADKLRQTLDTSRLEAPKAEPGPPAPAAASGPDGAAAMADGGAPPAGTVAQGTWPPAAPAAAGSTESEAAPPAAAETTPTITETLTSRPDVKPDPS
jgi:TatA/E family protein of Tat protein translocase